MTERINVEISGDSQKLIAALKSAGVEVKKFSRETEDAGKSGKRFSEGVMSVNKAAAALGLAGATTAVVAFGKASLDMARSQNDARNALTSIVGSTENYRKAIDQVRAATRNTLSETEAAQTAFGLLDNGIAKSAEEAAQYALAGKALNAALGETASYEKFLMLLDEGSSALTNNFNITQSAIETRWKLIEANTDLEGSEARLQAIRELALEKGLALSDTLSQETVEAQQAAAAYEDLQASMGQLLVQLDKTTGATSTATWLIGELTDGAKAWQGVFDNVATISEINEEAAKSLGIEYDHLNAALASQKITLDEWEAAQGRAAEKLRENAAYADDLKRSIYDLTDATTESIRSLATWNDRTFAISSKAMAASGSRYAAYAAGTRTNPVLVAQKRAEAERAAAVQEQQRQEEELAKEREQAARKAGEIMASSFDAAASRIESVVSSVVSQSSSLSEVFNVEELVGGGANVDENARRMAALFREGFQSQAWVDELKTSLQGVDVAGPLLDALEAGDQESIKAQAGNLLKNNIEVLYDIDKMEQIARLHLTQQQAQQRLEKVLAERLGAEGALSGAMLDTVKSDENWPGVGSAIVEGVDTGIDQNYDRVVERIKDMAKEALTAAEQELGISSPSTVFMDVGANIVSGLEKGVTDNMKSVLNLFSLQGTFGKAIENAYGVVYHKLHTGQGLGEEKVSVIAKRLEALAQGGGKQFLTEAGTLGEGAFEWLFQKIVHLGGVGVTREQLEGAAYNFVQSFNNAVTELEGMRFDELSDQIQSANTFFSFGQTLAGNIQGNLGLQQRLGLTTDQQKAMASQIETMNQAQDQLNQMSQQVQMVQLIGELESRGINSRKALQGATLDDLGFLQSQLGMWDTLQNMGLSAGGFFGGNFGMSAPMMMGDVTGLLQQILMAIGGNMSSVRNYNLNVSAMSTNNLAQDLRFMESAAGA